MLQQFSTKLKVVLGKESDRSSVIITDSAEISVWNSETRRA